MSDLGEISAEVEAALGQLDRVLARFGQLDRAELAVIEAELRKTPQGRQAVAMVASARTLVRQARAGAQAARQAGAEWLMQHGSAQRGAAWSAGFSTPGGRAYYPPAETDLREAAAALPAFPGEYTFDAHGRSDRVVFDGEELTAADVAALILADQSWAGRPIRLFSCNTGHGEDPIAAEVAKEAGVPVTAPDGWAWSSADGRSGVAPIKQSVVNGAVVEVPDFDNEGEWRRFDPS